MSIVPCRGSPGSLVPLILSLIGVSIGFPVSAPSSFGGQLEKEPITQRRWFEVRTAHFRACSCVPTQEAIGLTIRLEQFHTAYSLLAGMKAVASPPIVVMIFPSHADMKPFLPLYQDKPANLSAFFSRNSDENLIVLPLAGAESG